MITLPLCLRLLLVSLFFGLFVSAQTIPNPSFEDANSFSEWPGYGGGTNGAIPGWTYSSPIASGLNPVLNLGQPFADNGMIPDGNLVAFIQSVAATADSQLSTTITGLTPGQTYRVSFRANARAGNQPVLKVFLDNDTANPLPISRDYSQATTTTVILPVGGANPYHTASFAFTATSASHVMTIRNAQSGDNTLLIDAFTIAPEVITTNRWTDDASSGIAAITTLWAYNFGGSQSTTVNGFAVPAIEQTSGTIDNANFTLIGPNQRGTDSNENTSSANDLGTAQLAYAFFYGGNSENTLTLKGLNPGVGYILSILTVGWTEDNFPADRATTLTTSDGVSRTLAPGEFFQNNGTRIDIPFTPASETYEITIAVANNTGATLHFYGLALSSDNLIVTNTNDSGTGSLRAALEIAKTRPGPDTILFSPNLDGAEIFLDGLPDPTYGPTAFTIDDADGVIVSAVDLPNGLTLRPNNRDDRAFSVTAGSVLSLRGLTVRGFGGGGQQAGLGGAILNEGTVESVLCTFSANSGSLGGGAIYNLGALIIDRSTFAHNLSWFGGAIASVGTIVGETPDFIPAILTVKQSTFTGNEARTHGGAIANFGTLNLLRSTLHANRSIEGSGGAVSNQGTATLFHCTLANNSAAIDGGAILNYVDENTIIPLPSPSVKITNSILAYNTAPAGPNLQILDGSLVPEGTLFIDDLDGTALSPGGAQLYAIYTNDPFLAPLADYGGPTETMALRGGSNPARDYGFYYAGNNVDQRGWPVLGPADVGAYEAGSAVNFADYLAEALPATGPASGVTPGGDFDGDGISNEDEIKLFGTDPTDANSVFRPILGHAAANVLALSFLSIPGYIYDLERWDAQTDTWIGQAAQTRLEQPPGPPLPVFFLIDLSQGADEGLYRIVVKKP